MLQEGNRGRSSFSPDGFFLRGHQNYRPNMKGVTLETRIDVNSYDINLAIK
jgi:hypothetical protein